MCNIYLENKIACRKKRRKSEQRIKKNKIKGKSKG